MFAANTVRVLHDVRAVCLRLYVQEGSEREHTLTGNNKLKLKKQTNKKKNMERCQLHYARGNIALFSEL